MDGWESYTSAGRRRNRRGTQVLDFVIAERVLYSLVPRGGPELLFVLRNLFCSPQTSPENEANNVLAKIYNPYDFGLFIYLLFIHERVTIDHLKHPSQSSWAYFKWDVGADK